MSPAGAEYYVRRRLDTGAPTVVYRFFADENKTPEAFSKQYGWRPDEDLWLQLMSGDLTSSDQISEEEASALVSSWGGSL